GFPVELAPLVSSGCLPGALNGVARCSDVQEAIELIVVDPLPITLGGHGARLDVVGSLDLVLTARTGRDRRHTECECPYDEGCLIELAARHAAHCNTAWGYLAPVLRGRFSPKLNGLPGNFHMDLSYRPSLRPKERSASLSVGQGPRISLLRCLIASYSARLHSNY